MQLNMSGLQVRRGRHVVESAPSRLPTLGHYLKNMVFEDALRHVSSL